MFSFYFPTAGKITKGFRGYLIRESADIRFFNEYGAKHALEAPFSLEMIA